MLKFQGTYCPLEILQDARPPHKVRYKFRRIIVVVTYWEKMKTPSLPGKKKKPHYFFYKLPPSPQKKHQDVKNESQPLPFLKSIGVEVEKSPFANLQNN